MNLTHLKIPFNRPAITGNELSNFEEMLNQKKFSGDGPFARECNGWLTEHFSSAPTYVTTSCTHSLEMAAILCDVGFGDEVILPSYAFSSTATAFARCGAKLVFVDIDPSTMNISPQMVEAAITEKTRVIVALHYAGVACDMEALNALARKHDLVVVEDAAQSMFSTYKGIPCGNLGDYGCISFHESKNIHCGEGGAFTCNNARNLDRVEIIMEKGTNRKSFFRGEIDKYTWVDIGSSYILSDINSAFLMAQLESGEVITKNRLNSWNIYQQCLQQLVDEGRIDIAEIPVNCKHNGHIFWIKSANLNERNRLIDYLKTRGIHSVFHYQPLHSSPAGLQYGEFVGEDLFTTKDSERLLRLPLFYGFDKAEFVSDAVKKFYSSI